MHPELEVQKYLRSGKTPQDLKNELDIRFDNSGDLWGFTYTQTDSPKMHPIVLECRGIILDERQNWKVIYMPFKRFFNHGEAQEMAPDKDDEKYWTRVKLMQKIDGTLLGVWWYKNKWNFSTRGRIHALGHVDRDPNKSFADLATETIKENYPDFWNRLDKEYTYTFELTSPENRVVVPYKEKGLTLLQMREVKTLQEVGVNPNHAQELGVASPEIYENKSINDLMRLVNSWHMFEEGIVAVDTSQYYDGYNFSRVKIKNLNYLAVAHIKEDSTRGLVTLMLNSNEAEFLLHYPEYTEELEGYKEKYSAYLCTVMNEWEKIKDIEDRKEFAMVAKVGTNPSILFSLKDGKYTEASDHWEDLIGWKGEKMAAKIMMKYLGI